MSLQKASVTNVWSQCLDLVSNSHPSYVSTFLVFNLFRSLNVRIFSKYMQVLKDSPVVRELKQDKTPPPH